MLKQIKTALISVYHKQGLEDIIAKLHAKNVRILSTGGTLDYIHSLGATAEAVEDLTAYPSIFGGRVKTLHPAIFGGILQRRNHQGDAMEALTHQIPEIDLVIVDLYPFEDTLKAGGSEEEMIEKIDIGGISLIRAAAKNFKDVLIIPSQNEYKKFDDWVNETLESDIKDRKEAAFKAFAISSNYDNQIAAYIGDVMPSGMPKVSERKTLRYGENPHQEAAFIGNMNVCFDQLHGKELSYNNLLDIDAALLLVGDFDKKTCCCAILKHNNACGIAQRNDALTAFEAALAADPVSAFGGIICFNQKVDAKAAESIDKIFCEVVMAPGFSEEALTILKNKKNRIILHLKDFQRQATVLRTNLNGVLLQAADNKQLTEQDLKVQTQKAPSKEDIADLLFANVVVKHTKSNTIVLAKNKQLIASGTGQTSRVDALKQAIMKAKNFNFDLNGAVMASDAFFPFPDCVEIAEKEGIKTVIQPGGSVKDQASIDYCNNNGMSMVFTGTRHFKH